jgi:hypothetical protein
MSDTPTEVLEGVEAVIDHYLLSDEDMALGYRYFHKRTCNALSKNPPKVFHGSALVAAIYERIESNLASRPKESRAPSAQNWRLRLTDDQESILPNIQNRSAEVNLERAIVKKWPLNWTYQLPVASGLFDGRSDKRRAVDLVFDHGDRHYDLVELKIKSDTPLYAAMEILGYGLIYLASRRDTANNLGYESVDLPILIANRITLCVLAPEIYYQDYPGGLIWLQDGIMDGLKRFEVLDLSIDFCFQKFSAQFGNDLPIKCLPETLVREPAWQ